jgi:hypothetical protein
MESRTMVTELDYETACLAELFAIFSPPDPEYVDVHGMMAQSGRRIRGIWIAGSEPSSKIVISWKDADQERQLEFDLYGPESFDEEHPVPPGTFANIAAANVYEP